MNLQQDWQKESSHGRDIPYRRARSKHGNTEPGSRPSPGYQPCCPPSDMKHLVPRTDSYLKTPPTKLLGTSTVRAEANSATKLSTSQNSCHHLRDAAPGRRRAPVEELPSHGWELPPGERTKRLGLPRGGKLKSCADVVEVTHYPYKRGLRHSLPWHCHHSEKVLLLKSEVSGVKNTSQGSDEVRHPLFSLSSPESELVLANELVSVRQLRHRAHSEHEDSGRCQGVFTALE